MLSYLDIGKREGARAISGGARLTEGIYARGFFVPPHEATVYLGGLEGGASGLRIGVPRSPFWDDLDPGVREVADRALQSLQRAGADLVELALPGVAETAMEAGFPIALFEFVRDMRHYLASRERGVTLEDALDIGAKAFEHSPIID